MRHAKDEVTIRVKVIKTSRRSCFVLRWRDPASGRFRQKESQYEAKKTLRRLAEREARDLEAELADKSTQCDEIPWNAFCTQYERDHLSGLAAKSVSAWHTAQNRFASIIRPILLTDVTAATMSQFASTLRRQAVRETTIACYVRTIRAALGWARSVGLLVDVPAVPAIRRAKGVTKRMRGRPITAEEFDRFLAAVPRVRPDDAPDWERLLRGLWLSGLRLREALALSWDWGASLSVDLDSQVKCLRIHAEGEKGHSDRIVPLSGDFATWLEDTPREQRRGRVLRISRVRCPNAIGRTISAIGEKAGIIVSSSGRTATAHDLRRSFASRWATKLSFAELRTLMRHQSVSTTMAYYVSLDAADLARKMGQKGGATGGARTYTKNERKKSRIAKDPQAVDE